METVIKNDSPKTVLSIIIPVYNTPQQLLEHCISSIQQNIAGLDGVEVLMINDGSTEPSVEPQLQTIAKSDPRFHYVFKANSGVSHTRNMGIYLARGTYIMFIDADDYLEHDVLHFMLQTAVNSAVDMSMFGFCYDDASTIKVSFRQRVEVNDEVVRTLVGNDMTRWYQIGTNLATVWAKIYKRETLVKNHIRFLQDIAPHEDGFFNLCLVSKIPAFYVDNTLVYHYVTFEESAVHCFSNREVRVSKSILPKLEAFARQYAPGNEDYIKDIGRRTLNYIRYAKELYFTHPQNTKSFWELKREMDDFLSTPIIRKYIKKQGLSEADNKLDAKNLILLKLRLYWLFLLTERRKRKA